MRQPLIKIGENMQYNKNVIPDFTFNKITEINPDFFLKNNIEAVGLDLDNTTVLDESYFLIKGVKGWINSVKKAGIKVCIITNTYNFRAEKLSKRLGCNIYFSRSNKPETKVFFDACEKMNVEITRFAMIGDRIMTDILGANEAGAVSIRVLPYHKEIFLFIYWYMKRKKEEKILNDTIKYLNK